MPRILDFFVALLMSVALLVPCAVIAIVISLSSHGPVIYWSERVGRFGKPFKMPKFRTMVADAPTVATEDLVNPQEYITSIGRFLRRTSIDELPQLYSVLVGDMSLVGPRPVLTTQEELLDARRKALVHTLRPGITGWAQINGRDQVELVDKIRLEVEYLHRRSFAFDLIILWRTLSYVLSSKGISH